MHRLLSFLIVLCASCSLLCGQGSWVILEGIEITGNDKTRPEVITRELPFRVGDTLLLSELPDLIQEGKQQVMNTSLFNSAIISYQEWDGKSQSIRLSIEVVEGWYIFPLPIFELADRNFNVWWTEQNRSLQRVNFGMEFSHLNFSGWRDRIKLKIKYGYTRTYSISYSLPYINKAQTLGMRFNFGLRRNREINYATFGNKQEFFRDEDNFVYQRLGVGLGLSFRPKQYAQHNLYLGFRRNRIDTVISNELNPEFFLDGRQQQRYFDLAYEYSYDKRDVRAYAWSGYNYGGVLEKDGLGFFDDRSGLTAFAWYQKFFPIGKKFNFSAEVRGKYSFIRKRQPFNDYRALGFGAYTLPGYEFYVVDGQDMIMFKPSFRFRFLDSKITFGKIMPLEAFRQMPVRLHLGLIGGVGYVSDPFTAENNLMANRQLWSAGISFDIVLYYDKVFQIQYSMNHLKERGIYLHFDTNL